MRMKNACAAGRVIMVLLAGATGAAPVVSDVRLAQRTDSRTAEISYRLTGDNAYITVAIETNALAAPEWAGIKIPDSRVTRLSGDVSRLITADASNDKHIVWNAGAELPGVEIAEARAVVTAWSTNYPPSVLVFDLGGDYQGGDYFTQHTITALGFPSLEALPHGGLTNDIYRTSLLVMRRIDSGAFVMGSPFGEPGRYANENLHQVTLSHAFYMGVFEFTKGQWRRIKYAAPTTILGNPADSETYDNLRGGSWPDTDDVIAAGSLIGTLRSRCANAFAFDLPTEAQWEYACRAGTQTTLHNGKDLTSTTNPCPNRAEIAWDSWTSGNYHHRVGEKLPNAWGLYDMIGNVYELVRDRYQDQLGSASAVDPVGPETGDSRVQKGGAWNGKIDPRSAYRGIFAAGGAVGLRLAIRPLEGTPVPPAN